MLSCVESWNDPFQNVKQLGKLVFSIGKLFQLIFIHLEYFLDDSVKLWNVVLEVLNEVFIYPKRGQDLVKLTQMLVVSVVLQNVEAHLYHIKLLSKAYDMILDELLYQL